MYAKFISETEIEQPPQVFTTPDGEKIYNFDKKATAMIAHGYYPVVPEPSLDNGMEISEDSRFRFVRNVQFEDIEEPTGAVELDENNAVVRETGETRPRRIKHDNSKIYATWVYRPTETMRRRDETEKAIVAIILGMAKRYGALADLRGMQEVTIPGLMALAERYGVADAELQAAETKILLLTRELEAITELTWGDTWKGLKARFRTHLADLLQS